MLLDVQTLFLMNVGMAVVMAGVWLFYWHGYRDIAGLVGWAAGYLLGAAGALGLAFSSATTPLPYRIAASAVVVAAYGVTWQSIRQFNGKRFRLLHALAPVAPFVVLDVAALLLGEQERSRAVVTALMLALLSLVGAWEVGVGGRREGLRSRMLTAAALFAMAAGLAVRVVTAIDAPLPADPLHDPMRASLLLVNTICLIAATFGLLLMINERLGRRLERLASIDELTGLFNRRTFFEQGKRIAQRATREGWPLSVLMMDLDHFSAVNERFGHAGGDRALAAVAAFVRAELKPGDIVGRYGGEEFCVLLHGDQAVARRVAERLRAGVASLAVDIDGQTLSLTISVGMAPVARGDLRASLGAADLALYGAKKLGRNVVIDVPELPMAPSTPIGLRPA